jgi:predicted nucleotidyltransferase
MNMQKLFSSVKRRKILEEALFSSAPLQVSSLARKLKVSKALVSQFLQTLSSEGLAEKKGRNIKPKDNHGVKALKILLSLDKLDLKTLAKHDFVRGAGIYGSAVKGENTPDSDTDLWILVDETTAENLSQLTAELRKKNPGASPLYLTRKKLQELKGKDRMFYHSLYFGSIHAYGERIETA